MTTIEGVGEAISPDFDLIGHVSPHVERLVKRRYGFRAMRERVVAGTRAYSELIERLPRDFRDLSRALRRDQLRVRLQHQGLDELRREVEHASQNISYALIIASLIVGGAILFLADSAAGPGGGPLFYAGIATLAMAAALAAIRVTLAFRR